MGFGHDLAKLWDFSQAQLLKLKLHLFDVFYQVCCIAPLTWGQHIKQKWEI